MWTWKLESESLLPFDWNSEWVRSSINPLITLSLQFQLLWRYCLIKSVKVWKWKFSSIWLEQWVSLFLNQSFNNIIITIPTTVKILFNQKCESVSFLLFDWNSEWACPSINPFIIIIITVPTNIVKILIHQNCESESFLLFDRNSEWARPSINRCHADSVH